MRISALSVFLLLATLLSFTQNPVTVPTFQTPSVSALNKYIDFPVDKSTGAIEINVPIYNLQVNRFQLPVSLSYHGGGIKVEEQASNFGLGWALNCGGVISRSIKGNRPDEFGYYATNGAAPHNLPQYSDAGQSAGHYAYFNEIPGNADTEADVFYFSFNGYNGKFIFDSSRNINLVPEQDIKIELGSFFSSSPGYTFKATTPDGTQYFFSTQNQSKALYIDGEAGDQVTTAWNLDHVITPDLKTITFQYEQEGQTALRSLAHENALTKNNVCPIISYITNNVNVYGNKIIKVSSDNTEIKFIYKTSLREDYYASNSTYLAIDSVKVFDKTSGELRKTLAFGTSYFQSTAPNLIPSGGAGGGPAEAFLQKRLRLDSLWEVGTDGSTIPPIKFFYNKHDTTQYHYLPTRLSMGQDAWGYYNGKDANTSLYPSLTDPYNANTVLCNTGNDRSVHEEYAEAFILDEIDWPTGGKTIYKYECIKDGATIVGGGLRIKQITAIPDAIQASIVKTYTYYSPTLAHDPNFTLPIDDGALPLTDEFYDYPSCTYMTNNTSGLGWVMAFSDPVITTGEFFSNYVYHGEVVEQEAGNGSVESYYDVASIADEVTSNYDNDDYPLIAGTISLMLKSGKLIQEITKNEAGTPIKSATYTYGTTGRNINGYSYKLFRPFCWQRYKMSGYSTGSVFLTEKTETLDDVTNTTDYEYGGIPYLHHFVTKETTMASDGKTLITNLKYPKDYSSGSFISSLNDKYMIGFPIEKTVSRNGRIISGEITTFKNSDPVVDTVFRVETTSPIDANTFSLSTVTNGTFIKDSRYSPEVAYNRYDAVKNIIEYQKVNDIKTSFVWDYNNSYPVAKVVGADGMSIAYTSFEADGNGNWNVGSTNRVTGSITGSQSYNLSDGSVGISGLDATASYKVSWWSKPGASVLVSGAGAGILIAQRNGWNYSEAIASNTTSVTVTGTGQIDELRLYPLDAQMTTCTYQPLVGITSQCDINNRITYYEYDDMNRLALVRDQDKNILKKFCYNYTGQSETCPLGVGNVVKSGNFTRNDCSVGVVQVTYTVPANRYFAATQATADALAQADVNANGQSYANANGVCPVIYARIEYQDQTVFSDDEWPDYANYDESANVYVRFYSDPTCLNQLILGHPINVIVSGRQMNIDDGSAPFETNGNPSTISVPAGVNEKLLFSAYAYFGRDVDYSQPNSSGGYYTERWSNDIYLNMGSYTIEPKKFLFTTDSSYYYINALY